MREVIRARGAVAFDPHGSHTSHGGVSTLVNELRHGLLGAKSAAVEGPQRVELLTTRAIEGNQGCWEEHAMATWEVCACITRQAGRQAGCMGAEL